MNSQIECMPCLLQGTNNLFNQGLIPKEKQKEIFKQTLKILAEKNFDYPPPYIARLIHQKIRDITGITDPYKEIKADYNQRAVEIMHEFKNTVFKGKSSFFDALKLAIMGNIIDFGINHDFDLNKTINRFHDITFAINDSEHLKKDIENSSHILYLGDNAGEIVFDAFFLKTINHPNVTYVVRGGPIINDVTFEDAIFAGIDQYAKIIDSGLDIPGVIIDKTSDNFKEAYNKADFVISKGQGNYECLNMIKDKKIYFLLMTKCVCVARDFNLDKGEIVVSCNLNTDEE